MSPLSIQDQIDPQGVVVMDSHDRSTFGQGNDVGLGSPGKWVRGGNMMQ